MHDGFRIFSVKISQFFGSLWALLILVIALGLSGYYFDFSEKWEIHAALFLAAITMVLLIFLQKSQNHNDKATHLKLDELIKASEGARNEVASVEEQAEEDIDKLK